MTAQELAYATALTKPLASRAFLCCALMLSLSISGGCSSTETAGEVSTYPLDGDYAAAAAYTGVYADDWAGLGYPFLRSQSESSSAYDDDGGPSAADAGLPETASSPIAAIRALALGSSDICPGQVMVEQQRMSAPCAGSDALSGVTMNFMGCKLEGGGTLDGMLQLSRTQTASNTACDASTTLTVDYNVNFQNLSYVAPDGKKILIKSLTGSGKYDRTINSPPSSISSQLDADIQRYDSSGNLKSDRTLSGMLTFSIATSPPSVTVTGNLSASDANSNDGMKTTIKIESLKRDQSCCHAIDGTVTVTGAENTTVMFGPSCGAATQDGKSITLSGCP